MSENFFDDLNRQRYKKIQPWIVNKKVLDIGVVGHEPAGSRRPGWLHHLLRKDAAIRQKLIDKGKMQLKNRSQFAENWEEVASDMIQDLRRLTDQKETK